MYNSDFTEKMRAIGYPRVISMENFKNPNFELVADVLYWMVSRYDPNANVHDTIETENDRVKFLSDISKHLAADGINLNSKSLYAANGYAVKELLKLANILHQSLIAVENYEGLGNFDDFAMSLNRGTVKKARALASEITEQGSRLHQILLSYEDNDDKCALHSALSFLDVFSSKLEYGPEHEHIERQVQRIIESTRNDANKLYTQQKGLESDERILKEQITRAETDLERTSRRLESLDNIRPAFMEEYDELEKELKVQYEAYVIRFRNLHYLEHELDIIKKAEKEVEVEREKAVHRIQRKMKDEEMKLLRGDDESATFSKRSVKFDERSGTTQSQLATKRGEGIRSVSSGDRSGNFTMGTDQSCSSDGFSEFSSNEISSNETRSESENHSGSVTISGKSVDISFESNSDVSDEVF